MIQPYLLANLRILTLISLSCSRLSNISVFSSRLFSLLWASSGVMSRMNMRFELGRVDAKNRYTASWAGLGRYAVPIRYLAKTLMVPFLQQYIRVDLKTSSI